MPPQPRAPPVGRTAGARSGRSLLCGQGPVCPSSLRQACLLLSLVFTALLAGGCLSFYEVAPPTPGGWGAGGQHCGGSVLGRPASPGLQGEGKGPLPGAGPLPQVGPMGLGWLQASDGGKCSCRSPVLGGRVSPVPQEGCPGSPRPEPLEASRSEARPPHPETLLSEAGAFLVL